MAFKVTYKSSVWRDLKQLDKREGKRLLTQIETDLAQNPQQGEPLKGRFKGLFKYRVGNYRVIFTRFNQEILDLRIGHRKDVYR